jgi:hypothetical protein
MKFFVTILSISLSATLAFSQNNPVQNLDVNTALENPGKCMLSSVASKVSYIPLEAKPGSFIKNIDRFTLSDDLIKTFKYFGFSSGRWLTDDMIVLAMDYLVSKGKMIVTLDRQGKEVGAGLINSVLPKTNSDPAWTRLTVCPVYSAG